MKTNIIVNLQVEGTHCWPGCDIKPVKYLQNEHRHVFHITAKKEVDHDDRDIEIITLKRDIEEWIKERYGRYGNFETMSCEMIAKETANAFYLDYCSVLEDGENGAEVIR